MFLLESLTNLNFTGASQLGAPASRVFFRLGLARNNRAASQNLNLPGRAADTFRQTRRTLALTGKLLQRPLDDAIFKRVKTDYRKTPVWF